MSGDNQFTSAKYQGHTAPVLCLAVSEDYSCLLSGSEDHTARLWDLRENSRRRASLCIQAGGEVLSVTFTPTNESMPSQEGISSDQLSSSPFAKDHSIYLSVENSVLEYDLRQAVSPIINQPYRDLTPILQNQDEVNQVALVHHTSKPSAPKGKKKGNKKSNKKTIGETKLYLAASDDAGTIRLMDSAAMNTSQVLHHDENAVVPAVAFRPGLNKGNLELASGGTDCQIMLWDAFKTKRPISSIATSTPETETGKAQVCNPPMVYSLSWSQSGNVLAAGLGDGSVSLMGIQNRNLVQTGHMPYAHDASVASVHFPSFCRDKSERVLFSGGSDGIVLCWDLGSNIVQHETVNPKSLFSPNLLKGSKPQSNNGGAVAQPLAQQMEGMSMLDNPEILFGIQGEKINWMESAKDPDTLFVADTSNDITAYTIPMLQ